jgi:A/G-specific adenine glycosylase
VKSPEFPFSPNALVHLQRGTLAWYRRERRDLPWRRTADPYRIWISEVMLQQTRVETVRPYYARFLSRFPTVQALAGATEDEVLEQWSGLGYYSRARSLHRAARMVVEVHGGALPHDPALLAKLPGFGPYTTAAVGSIALGLDLAAVDGNIARVLTRWLCSEDDPREARVLGRLRRVAAALLPQGEAGDWNQALMELGATLCAPTSPNCGPCPAAAHCLARLAGREGELPPRRKAPSRPVLRWAGALARKGEEVLLAKRPEEGLFGSLWELPTVQLEGEETEEEALRQRLGLGPGAQGRRVCEVVQILTHREVRLAVWEVPEAPSVGAPYVEARWADPISDPPGGLSSLTRKALLQASAGFDPGIRSTMG